MARGRSSAAFISYDVRPAKQTERRIILDLLRIAGECGLPLSEYRYVGMGANRFYEYLMIHKYLSIKDMVSLERNGKMFRRAEYSKPFNFITLLNQPTSNFISKDRGSKSSVYWFDYDDALGPGITDDMTNLATHIKLGDFFFVTVSGYPPGVLERSSQAERYQWLRDQFEEFAGEVLLDDTEDSTFYRAVYKILLAGFKNAFATKREGVFAPVLRVRYTDSQPMITVGGGYLAPEMASRINEKVDIVLPFLRASEETLYDIGSFHLTERERHLFDLASTSETDGCPERVKLIDLGFEAAEVEHYKEMLRFLPRYVETMV